MLDGLIPICSDKSAERLEKFKTYIVNHTTKMINYRDRQKSGLPFTSHFAESTVESFNNQRCKGEQYMRWSREGLDPILQIAIASNDWDQNWRKIKKAIV